PLLAVKGALVIGLTGFLNSVLSAVKLPARCASVGTIVWLDPASARSQSRWYDPNQNNLFWMMAPPALAPAWFCFCCGLRVWEKLGAFRGGVRGARHGPPRETLAVGR